MFSRMKCATIVLASLTVLFGSVGQTQAGIINGSFESGLSGWAANPGGLVFTTGLALGYTPVDGSKFAYLVSGNGPNTYTTLSQSFVANAGDTITGSAFFKTIDYLPYNDDGYVKIIENGQVLFQSNVASAGSSGSTPWTNFSYTLGSGGTFTIEAGVRNYIDNSLESYLGVDNVEVTSAVPEPASMITLAAGAIGMLGFRMRKRRLDAGLVA